MVKKTDLTQPFKKAFDFPALSHVYALEVDRQLRAMGKEPITFSARGLAENAPVTPETLGLGGLFPKNTSAEPVNAIFWAETLIKEGKGGEALAHAFTHAQGEQINALNLLYANHATQRSELRLHYLNKYLRAYGLRIDLAQGEVLPFFHRLRSNPASNKADGPLVTVIMPSHNAEGTIELAVGSLFNQTWQNLQIIIVDDASTDSTPQKAKDLAKRDPRVEVLRSPVNVGPYVCRNLGVLHTRGEWLTVHDADDWAFPDRIEQQVQALTTANALACTGRMLRMNEQGQIRRPTASASTAQDGYLRLCFVSLMVQTAYFRNELGAWDSVRVGGDAEMIERLKVLGTPQRHLQRPVMLCLDHEAGLTNHHELGLADETGQTQPLRADYKQAFIVWHNPIGPKKLCVFGKLRSFDAPKANLVDQSAIKNVFATWLKNLELIKASELFDADWYKSQYHGIEQTGLEAAEHYLVHGATGATDPSPDFSSRFYLSSRSVKVHPLVHSLRGKDSGANPKRVLLAAAEVAKTGEHERAISLAETHLPPELAYTSHILKANAALAKGDEAGWQTHTNAYLSHFDVAPIRLSDGEGTLFDRLATGPLQPVTDGPLVTVIMPAWNAEKTVRKAAQSILNQTWRNLELLIVDDASTDGTWTVLQAIAASDTRVKIFRNKVNVGPYVSKNIALTQAKGAWITGHDADDWAHPQRLERHLGEAQVRNLDASLVYMIKITSEGNFSHIAQQGSFCLDGVARKASISCLFSRKVLTDMLGYWDTVRFGADSEMIMRAEKSLGDRFGVVEQIAMLCQDLEASLTNHPVHGVNKQTGISPVRSNYRVAWTKWLKDSSAGARVYLDFPQGQRRYDAAAEMVVPWNDQVVNVPAGKK